MTLKADPLTSLPTLTASVPSKSSRLQGGGVSYTLRRLAYAHRRPMSPKHVCHCPHPFKTISSHSFLKHPAYLLQLKGTRYDICRALKSLMLLLQPLQAFTNASSTQPTPSFLQFWSGDGVRQFFSRFNLCVDSSSSSIMIISFSAHAKSSCCIRYITCAYLTAELARHPRGRKQSPLTEDAHPGLHVSPRLLASGQIGPRKFDSPPTKRRWRQVWLAHRLEHQRSCWAATYLQTSLFSLMSGTEYIVTVVSMLNGRGLQRLQTTRHHCILGKWRVQQCALPARLARRMISESPQKSCSPEIVRYVQAIMLRLCLVKSNRTLDSYL
jgi:hypothetical protein